MAPTVSDIKDFTRALVGNWWTTLSGLFSVPATFLSLWVSNDAAKIVWGLTAFVCLWVTAYRVWKPEHDKVVERDQQKRKLLDDIAVLRKKVGDYRIAMEADHSAQKFNQQAWEQKYEILEKEIAAKIEQLSSKAEAETFLYRGNIQRAFRPNRPGATMWPVLVDVSIRDLDYLETFIHAHSRGR